MKIRVLEPDDIPVIKEIHTRDYTNPFPDFTKFIVAFVVTDDEGKIISAGGIRAIIESVLVTDLSLHARDRRQALLMMLEASSHYTNRVGQNQLHAFIEDEKWYNQLKRYGFKDCIGKPVYIDT